MKILIVGAGAVGVSMLIALVEADMDVTVVARGTTADKLRDNGAARTGIFGEKSIPSGSFKVNNSISEVEGNYDYVLVSTKTTANADIALQMSLHNKLLAPEGTVVLMQNGWGYEEEYRKYFDDSKIYNARIITGFEKTNEWTSKVTVHTAPILLGSLFGADQEKMNPIAEAINASGIQSESTDKIAEALWAKMLFNTTLNPLGAILSCTYGELAAHNNSMLIMNRLIDETYAVMQSKGYKTFWASADEYKEVFYGKLVVDTAKHHSSTYQDIKLKRRTEIDTLNGIVIRLGEETGVPTPTHRTIYDMIKALEAMMD